MSGRPITSLRPPTYVSRETGAAELDFSVDTWDAMVKAGKLPQPVTMGTTGKSPRWLWREVEEFLGGRRKVVAQSEPEPFFRGLVNGKTKGGQRAAS